MKVIPCHLVQWLYDTVSNYRKQIPLDKNEGVYIQNIQNGQVNYILDYQHLIDHILNAANPVTVRTQVNLRGRL